MKWRFLVLLVGLLMATAAVASADICSQWFHDYYWCDGCQGMDAQYRYCAEDGGNPFLDGWIEYRSVPIGYTCCP